MGFQDFIPWPFMGTAQAEPAPVRSAPFPGRDINRNAPPPAAPPEEAWQPFTGGFPEQMGPPADLAMPAVATPAPTSGGTAPADIQGGKPPRGPKIAGTTEQGEGESVKASNLQIMIDELNNRDLSSLKQQGLSIEALKRQLGETEGRDMPVDLTGLAALTDAWTGSDFVGAYKPQETKASRRAEIERLQGAIAQGADNLSGREIDLLKSKLGMQMSADKLAYDQGQDTAQMDFAKKKHKDQQDLEWAKLRDDRSKDPNALSGKDAFDMRIKLGNTSSATQARGVTGFLGAMNEYERAVDKYGIRPTGEGKRVLDSAYAKMSTRFKEAENLGALAGPDLDLLRQNVGNAGDWSTWLTSPGTGGVTGLKAAMAQARRGAENDFNLAHDNLKATTSGVEGATQPVLDDYKKSFDQARGAAPVDKQAAALAWAKDPKNANDPRAAKILQHAGGK